ncbi:MAG: hydrogenase maturation protease [Actinobacteria bacterium]|nr:hydrogenase maturation protease [Actinomycetota bacterium]
MRILVAGVGNILRADDAFGVAVARRMDTMELPDGVKVVETGIGGMALVQELQDGWDALIVVDTVDLGRPPGHVMMILPDVIDVHTLDFDEKMDLLADMHLTTPSRVLMLSKALGVLPPKLMMVGCQPTDAETPGGPMELSPPVEAAVDIAIREILTHVEELLVEAAAARQPGAGDGVNGGQA